MITRAELREIDEELDAMLNHYFEKRGMILHMSGFSFGDDSFTTKLTVTKLEKSGSTEGPFEGTPAESDEIIHRGRALPGTIVFFNAKGHLYRGIITKKNIKTYSVTTTLGAHWRVGFRSARKDK